MLFSLPLAHADDVLFFNGKVRRSLRVIIVLSAYISVDPFVLDSLLDPQSDL